MATLPLPLKQPLSSPALLDPSRPLFPPPPATAKPRTSVRCAASVQETHIPLPKVVLQSDDQLEHDHDYDVDYCDVEALEGEDPRALAEIWREVQGSGDWEGLLDPMNSHLRREIIRYGEFAQACYDSFDFDPHSKYCGSCKYLANDFFVKMDMSNYGYHMCRGPQPDKKSSHIRRGEVPTQ